MPDLPPVLVSGSGADAARPALALCASTALVEKGSDLDAVTPLWAARLTAVQRRAEALVDGAGAQ